MSSRALNLFVAGLHAQRDHRGHVVALVDPDARRFEVAAQRYPVLAQAQCYATEAYEEMLAALEPDCVLVCGTDGSHARYVLPAVERGIDCVVEKPLATTPEDLNAICQAASRGPGKVHVAHNLRFSPMHRAIRDVVRSGMLGKVVLIDLQWTIDVTHGAAYFRRWHRHREHSGGLAVHKSSHHFDLVGFWLGDEPTEVVAMGGLHHYRPDSDFRPEQQAGVRCTTCSHQHSCVFQKENDHWRSQAGIDASAGFRHVAEYGINPPDACVFGGDTTVRDTFAVLVGWRSGATLSYSATFAAPYESFRLAISGTRGRLEVSHLIAPKRLRFAPWPTRMLFHPLFGAPQELALPSSVGSHDGGDEALIQALFPRWGAPPSADLATADEGARSVAVGLAAELSMDHGSPVSIRSLLRPSAEWAKALTPEVP